MMALRLARAFTGREKVLRLREHFHGWNDSVTGQPAPDETVPALSPGLPRGILEASIVLPQNDLDALDRALRDDGATIAAMIFEATGAHWGTEQIDLDYVHRARELTREYGVVLIFDEVITGFRVSPGGVRGDGGRIAHPGTYNANPMSAAAGVAALTLAADGTHQRRAGDTAAAIARGMNAILREESVAGCVYGLSSMLHIALGMERQPSDGYSWGHRALPVALPLVRRETARALRLGMRNEGVDLMGDGLMVSSAHTEDDVARTVEAFRSTLRAMKDERFVS